MRLRLVSVDELQFLTCLKYQLWGSKSARFKEWKIGDYLIFVVDKAIAGLAEVVAESYESKEKIWDNGIFPYRIPIKIVHAMHRENRPPILGQIRDILTAEWGTTYGWGIRNQQLLQDKSADTIVGAVRSQRNDLPTLETRFDNYFEEASLARGITAMPKKRGRPRKAGVKPEDTKKVAATKQEESEHVKAQSMLIQLGKVTGCSVWIAANDRNRQYRGKSLGDGCLKAMPNLGLTSEATKRITYIDVIWVRQNTPVYAFEIETTTLIYSGLLRMSDLLASAPVLNIKLFIVAPRDRQDKVMDELARPTFEKIGLNEYCRFVAIEDLNSLLTRVEDLQGHVQPTILNTIAVELEAELESALD